MNTTAPTSWKKQAGCLVFIGTLPATFLFLEMLWRVGRCSTRQGTWSRDPSLLFAGGALIPQTLTEHVRVEGTARRALGALQVERL